MKPFRERALEFVRTGQVDHGVEACTGYTTLGLNQFQHLAFEMARHYDGFEAQKFNPILHLKMEAPK
jgi:hypothetical protein